MWSQAYPAFAVALLALGGLAASNRLYDRGLNSSLSRRVPAVVGGAAFLMAVLWMEVWTAVTLSGAMALLVLALRLAPGRELRGVGGNSPRGWAEVTYAIAGAASLAVGWGLLGDRWLAFTPIAFLAWGDTAAGIARATAWRGNVTSIWPSVPMFVVCLAAAAVFQPYWIGAVGAVVATAAERFGLATRSAIDDNLVLVAASLGVMAVLVEIRP